MMLQTSIASLQSMLISIRLQKSFKIKFYIEVKGEMGCPKCYTSADAEAEKKVEAVRKSLGI